MTIYIYIEVELGRQEELCDLDMERWVEWQPHVTVLNGRTMTRNWTDGSCS